MRFQHSIKTLCRVLNVNRSTYYKHFKSTSSKRFDENQTLKSQISDVYSKSKKRFGAYKIKQVLFTEYGSNISVGRVYRLMKSMNLPKMSTIKPKYHHTQTSDSNDFKNILNQKFNPSQPNQVWVSDITYIRCNSKFVYLCVIIDLFARKVIAYSLSSNIDTTLTLSTLDKAYYVRNYPKNILFHSDRGVQYSSRDFRKKIDQLHFIQSFSAKAHPYDNAVVESFFKFLKLEELNRKSFKTFREIELSLFEYINFYNNFRPHSANQWLTPQKKEDFFFDSLN